VGLDAVENVVVRERRQRHPQHIRLRNHCRGIFRHLRKEEKEQEDKEEEEEKEEEEKRQDSLRRTRHR